MTGLGSFNVLSWCLVPVFVLFLTHPVLSEREGFFNKTSYVRLYHTLSLHRHIGLSFRTCEGGTLFLQRNNGYSVMLEVRAEGLLLSLNILARRYESRISANFLDNEWHTVTILHRLGNLTLSAAGHQVVVANSTFNSEILTNPELSSDSSVLIVGDGFTGCILEGPSIVFNNSQMQPHNVIWGDCPLNANSCSKVDYCSHEPCMMHGYCISRADRYYCQCAARYSGNNCEIDHGSPCESNPCKNGGACDEDKMGDITCHCASGFAGQFCETEATLQLCENNPCLNNGTCRISAGGSRYECTCLPGFTGKDCETNINECISSPCQHGGTCIDGINGYKCICGRTGYTGANCEININECENNPCLYHGVCFDTYGSYTCQCAAGFGGQNCELNLNECSSAPCQNSGYCIDLVGSYECDCRPGFTGRNCETDINECEGAICPPNSVCIDKAASYQCVCKPGYAGTPPNCIEADACSSSPCNNGGTCLPHTDGFNCSCLAGYTGALCEHALDFCVSAPCRNGGTCVGDAMTYVCECDPRYTGTHCETLVKCSANPCQHATSCQDYLGGYYCACEPGWTGANCDLDINECQSDPCRHGATCKDSVNAFYCECLPGFTGKMCQVNMDECSSSPCQHGGTCMDGINGYTCNCTEDYMGTNCELEYDACYFTPCQNNATCVAKPSRKEYYCECLPGFEGLKCENNINECLRVTCPDDKVCVDGINEYECRCPEGFTGENCTIDIDHCLVNPCQNNATCRDGVGNYTCICPPGYTGRRCEHDVNECEKFKNICNYGICLNNEGSYQCFCRPGFSGDHCDLDFDECLSRPCYNNATCENKINGFNCICTPGYTGQDCSININECESDPCMNGSTCIDEIATFSCACPPGLTGRLCETNIDDCESSPCQNGGICVDGINSYTCNCNDTGYEGIHCEVNIDDCASMPCTNGAECTDLIKDYQCNCFPGYTGKNCETDINECESNPCQFGGTCLERSNQSYYSSSDASYLPEIFKQPFNYMEASGYECLCVPGITGANCEININECESSPCKWGNCVDKVGSYACECEEGFEGPHCEIDIDECDRYKPCVYGTCIDRRAGYFCDCTPLYGGKNCSVELTGCKENQCVNGGTCKPYLENEVNHRFNCTCPNGFYGPLCEQSTTMSLSGSSYVMVNTTREEGYDIHFRFKTTLPNGLLAIGKGSTFYILELVHGRLNLHSSLLNKWEGVFIGSQLNDSNWQKVFVAINASHLVLAANEEQTIYPINLNEGANASHTSFPTTYLGGTKPYLSRLTHGPPSFVGCTQDVFINGQWVIPENYEGRPILLEGVEVGCPREKKCDPNPCHSGGHCTDLWRDFSCTCERPYLGHTCQYNLTAATFGHENVTASASIVTVTVDQAVRRAVRNIVDISMFIRTRQSTGGIFYLGSIPGSVPYPEETLIAAQLAGGELQVRIQFNGTPESYTVGGVKLDDGYFHLIQVTRNVTLVQVKINGTEYFRKTISATGQLDLQVLYLGGMPSPSPRYTRQLNTDKAPVPSFKGVIQDVQISNGSRIMVVQFFPLDVKDLELPPPVGVVTFDTSAVLQGVVSDDSCRSEPCLHGGTCEVTWNDFRCNCKIGHKGKQCEEMEFCHLKDCPSGSECRNLIHGYECVANVTLNGTASRLHYTLVKGDQSTPFNDINVSYRSKTGGTLLYIAPDSSPMQRYFQLSAYKDQITVAWRLNPDTSGEVQTIKRESGYSDWTTVWFKITDNVLTGGLVDNSEDAGQMFMPTSNFSVADWQELIYTSSIYIGGSEDLMSRHSYMTDGEDSNDVALVTQGFSHALSVYKGCIGEVRIGGLLLPYFTSAELNQTTGTANRDIFVLSNVTEKDFSVGCYLCFEAECINGGRCENANVSYKCECVPGFTGDDCSVNIDECKENQCQNNATCIDGLANYTCQCQLGWEGWLCENEIDECASNPCQNNGTCIDRLGYFECQCSEDYVGDQCDQLRQVTCENMPCKNGATCADTKNSKTNDNFTCTCTEGFVGPYCDTAYCFVTLCLNGGACNNMTIPPQCQCPAGFRGSLCEENIDDCLTQPCMHKGVCIDGIASFTCNCTGTGFYGQYCENDINECEDPVAVCGDKAKCINTIGNYTCECGGGLCGQGCNITDPCNEYPCQNRGKCVADCTNAPDYYCNCQPGFTGKNCTEPTQLTAGNVADIALILGPVVAILLIAGGTSLAVFLMMARKKRATRGTYSPSSQEYCNPRVELDNVMKPPPEERLI